MEIGSNMQEEDDSKLYLQASEEVEKNTQVEALWLKAMALTGGNEEKAGYKYIKLRVQQLKNGPLDNEVNHHSDIKKEQEDESIIEKTDTTTKQTSASNKEATQSKGFWKKLISGDFGLAKSYWLFLFGANIIFRLLFAVGEQSASAPFILGVVLIWVIYEPIAFIGAWRASDKYKGSGFWSGLVKVLVVFGWISYASGVIAFLSAFKGW